MSANDPFGAAPDLALQIGERQYALEPGRVYLLGSAKECDLRLQHESVSAHHARVSVRGSRLVVEDAGSTAGTFIGAQRVERSLVPPGTVVLLGRVPLLVDRDLGLAEIVPDPVMREAARVREAGATAAASTAVRASPAASLPAPEPVRVRRVRRSLAALPLRRVDEATFADLMADELRRAPWFTLSVLLHAAALLLLYLYLQPEPAGGPRSVQIGLEGSAGSAEEEDSAAGDLREAIEVEKADLDVPLVDEEFDPQKFEEEAAEPFDTAMLDGDRWLLGNPRIAPPSRRARGGNSGEDILAAGGEGLDTGGFVEQVTELRESGLEIVFVFDSTGSMSRVIDATKRRIHRTLDVLQALVPDARVGIVTYRDRGDEEYVTRHVPLGQDFYRAINFMQFVEADGGGDPPEAVLDGLQDAFGQQWRKGARRVVVLVGDAPPKPESRERLLDTVRRFQRSGTAYVHTVVTGAGRRDVRRAAEHAFREIAENGHGVCSRFENEEELLERLLTLAFGQGYEANLAEVDRLVAERRENVSSRALDLVRSGGERLLRELRKEPVSQELVQALVRMPRQGTALDLVAALSDGRFPENGRQAAAYALQQILALDRPPADPERGGPIARQQAAILESMAKTRLDP